MPRRAIQGTARIKARVTSLSLKADQASRSKGLGLPAGFLWGGAWAPLGQRHECRVSCGRPHMEDPRTACLSLQEEDTHRASAQGRG